MFLYEKNDITDKYSTKTMFIKENGKKKKF